MAARSLVLVAFALGCTPALPGESAGDDTTGVAPGTTGEATPTTSAGETAGATVDAVATGASSGEAPTGPVCGDGVVDGDEDCDDGNDDPVDGCDACALAPALQWTRMFDGPAHGWDNAQDVAFAADGSLLVVGSQESAVDNLDLVVRKLGPDGALVWERSFDGPVGGTDFGLVVAVDAEDGVLVEGAVDVTPEGDSLPWLRRYTGDGEEVWTFSPDASLPGLSAARAVAVDGDAVYLASGEQIAMNDANASLRRLDRTTGALQWERFDDLVGGQIVVLPGGDLLIVSTTEGSAALQWWSSGGEPGASVLYAQPGAERTFAEDVARYPDGDLAVLIGTVHDELTDARLLRFSAAGVFVSERPIAVDLEYYFLGSLTIDAQGRALVAGGVGTWDHDGFFGVYTEDGELLSSITMDGGFGKLDSFNGIAADPSGVALVGGVTTSDTVRDAWVVKLAP